MSKTYNVRSDGATMFVESSDPDLDRQIASLKGNGGGGGLDAEDVTAGVQINSDGSLSELGVNEGSSSHVLAEGELFISSLQGMPVNDLSKADPSQVLVRVKGMEVRLKEAIRLGLVSMEGDKVVARTAAAAPKPPAPATPLPLGERWEEHRKTTGARNVDNALLSTMAAVLDGKRGDALAPSLARLNEVAGINAQTPQEMKEVYNQLSNNVTESMGRQFSQAFPSEVPAKDGQAIINALLEVSPPDVRLSILTSAIHGDSSWIKRAEGILRKEIRIRGLDKKQK